MRRTTKISYLYSLLLVLLLAGASFSGVNGWCVESRAETVHAHIALIDCHSGFSVYDDTNDFNVQSTHTTDTKNCTTCFDIKPDIFAVKLFDDSYGVFVFPPHSNTLFTAQPYSDLKAFTIVTPGEVAAFDQSSFRQTQQNQSLRTVVLLI